MSDEKPQPPADEVTAADGAQDEGRDLLAEATDPDDQDARSTPQDVKGDTA